MYNEALKKQFIKDDTTNKNFDKFMSRYFETIEKYENEYGKDLANFNIQEIENYFVGLSSSSYERLQNIKSQFIKYCQYCQERNLIEDNQIHWQEVDGEFVRRTLNLGKLNEQLVTRKQLLKDLKQLNNASDVFLVLGIFEGLCGNKYADFHHLSTSQFIEKEGKTYVKLSDKVLEISRTLYDTAFESADCYERIPDSLDAKKNFPLNKEDPYVIKRGANSLVDSEETNLHNISKRLAAIRVHFDMPYCTQSSLMNSGRLHYLYTHSDNGKKDIGLVLAENYDILTKIYGRIQVKSALIDKYKQLYGEEK